jgi:hypothetical protein
MPKPKTPPKRKSKGPKGIKDIITRIRPKTKKDEIEERLAFEKLFMRARTKKGRAHDLEMAEHYAHAHQPESIEKGKEQRIKLEELESKRREAAREMAKHIAEMDKETEKRIRDLESIKAIGALEKARVELVNEELELEVMEHKVTNVMRESALKKKKLKWIKQRKKVVKKQLKRVTHDVSKLSERIKKERTGRKRDSKRSKEKALTFPGQKRELKKAA